MRGPPRHKEGIPSRWLAMIAAAILPGTGRDSLVHLDKTADADGVYPLLLPPSLPS